MPRAVMVVEVEADQAWRERVLFDAKGVLFLGAWDGLGLLFWDFLFLLFQNVFEDLAVMHF
jgi:hypothetical protein